MAHLLVTLQNKIVSFNSQKELYAHNSFFGFIQEECKEFDIYSSVSYVMQNGFLFKGTKVYICEGSLRELIIQELHNGGLGHFGKAKTLALV